MNPLLLIVTITGLLDTQGDVRCALHRPGSEFPSDTGAFLRVQQPAQPGTAECRFPNVPPGRYAVAVLVDRNKNGKTDKNFLGMPTEPWGVSNNVRHKTRAPRFEEAAFDASGAAPVRLTIQVAK
ncbi:MAG: DUF2141 domain-containing protein [Acidobacteria bacterium]|jgi:uncharacterized protein (DUF2141 family)|nr:DUF2141 domain-containing protein [Acidobacteriota bacterium]